MTELETREAAIQNGSNPLPIDHPDYTPDPIEQLTGKPAPILTDEERQAGEIRRRVEDCGIAVRGILAAHRCQISPYLVIEPIGRSGHRAALEGAWEIVAVP